MKLSLDNEKSVYLINSYTDNNVTIRGKTLSSSLIITPQTVIEGWEVDNIDDIEELHFSILDELNPELILLGTGKTQAFAPHWLYEIAIKHQMSVEVMNTGAACRTYNVLASEDRRIAAFLILDGDN